VFIAGNIGGIANLFIGISILTLCEIVEIIIYLFVTIYRHYKTERTVGMLARAQDDHLEDDTGLMSMRISTRISVTANYSM
jgi:hypothetical protein